MQCKSCNTQVPKRAKKCPKCGAPIIHDDKNVRVLAIAGAIIALIGGLLPFVQLKSFVGIAFGFMNGGAIMQDPSIYLADTFPDTLENYRLAYLDVTKNGASIFSVESAFGSMFWYIFMALLVATIILCVVKLEKYSIITTVAAAIVAVVYFIVIQKAHALPLQFDILTTAEKKDLFIQLGIRTSEDFAAIEALSTSTLRKRAYNAIWQEGVSVTVKEYFDLGLAEIGLGVYVTALGIVTAIAGVFVDIAKYFKKEMANAKLVTNKHSVPARMYTYRWFYLMFLPVLVFVIIFNYIPMLGIRYSFTMYNVGDPATYVGIYQFVRIFKEQDFWRAFVNTFEISIVGLLVNTFGAVVISLLLNEIVTIGFKKSVQTIIYLPHFMSWVVAAAVFRLLLADYGAINTILQSAGVTAEPIKFLEDKNVWRYTYFFVNSWKNVGWGTILYLATLSGISPDLYEAAQIDGANRWKRMRYITLPSLYNTIITVLILNLAKIMNLFESVFVMMNTSVTEVAEVVQTYVYNKTFSSGGFEFGLTTAVGLIRSMASMVLVLVCNYASKKVRGRGIV